MQRLISPTARQVLNPQNSFFERHSVVGVLRSSLHVLRGMRPCEIHVVTLLNPALCREIPHVLHPYTDLKKHQLNGPLIVARGDRIHVVGDERKACVDGLAALWGASLGFSECRLVNAAQR
jgi:hypothetical protein